MKRSDAIDIIDGILIDHNLPVLNGAAKEILAALERAGMTPPSYQAVFATGKKYVADRDFASDTFFAKGWEPE